MIFKDEFLQYIKTLPVTKSIRPCLGENKKTKKPDRLDPVKNMIIGGTINSNVREVVLQLLVSIVYQVGINNINIFLPDELMETLHIRDPSPGLTNLFVTDEYNDEIAHMMQDSNTHVLYFFESEYPTEKIIESFDTVISLKSSLALSRLMIHNTSAAYLKGEAISRQRGIQTLWELPLTPSGNWAQSFPV